MSKTSDEPINNFETNIRRSSISAVRRRPAPTPVGRYDRRRTNTWRPPQGLASVPESANADTAVAAVQDPWGDGQERLLVTVNRAVDILENERSHGRLSEAAYRTGRLVQEIFERSGRVGGSNWCGTSRVDPMMAHELKMWRTLKDAETIDQLVDRMISQIGMIDARLLRRVIAERMSFADCAASVGKAGKDWQNYYGRRFRDALEGLSEAWMGRGKAIPTPDDMHRAAAEQMVPRQDASIAKGVTAARKKAEAQEEAAKADALRKAAPRRQLGSTGR